jgi:hypothetical protein
LFIVTYNIFIFIFLMLLFMNHCNDFAPCGPSIGQYNSYSYTCTNVSINGTKLFFKVKGPGSFSFKYWRSVSLFGRSCLFLEHFKQLSINTFHFFIACSLCLNFFHLHVLARKPNLGKFSIYSNKFFHNFYLSESSFTCPGLWASG